jgi:hypothetical protein
MSTRAAVVLLTLLSAHALAAAAAAPASQPATAPSPAPVAAVWYEPSGTRVVAPGEPLEIHRLIVGVWSDGTVVWSDNRRTGGKPYWTGRIPRELVEKLLASLTTVSFFEPSKISGFGPDASITVIAAQAGDRRQWMGSWHDPPTTRPRAIFSEHGISAAAPGEPRPKPSADYQRFIEVWAESRRLIESVVPERSGQPIETVDEKVFRVGRKAR